MAVVNEMRDAGVYVFAGGLVEGGPVYSADPTSGTVVMTDGPYVETKEFLGGFAVVDVADDEAAKVWAAKISEGLRLAARDSALRTAATVRLTRHRLLDRRQAAVQWRMSRCRPGGGQPAASTLPRALEAEHRTRAELR